LDDLIAGGAQYLDRGGYVTNMKVEELDRGDLFANVFDLNAGGTTQASWPDATRKSFEKALRVVVESMLISPAARVYHWSGAADDDWGTDAWVTADPSSGIIKILIQDAQI